MAHLYSIPIKLIRSNSKPPLNELYHHGILGQKWGKKNGPPYPLDSGDHSTSERKAGYKKSIGGGRNEELYISNRKRRKLEKKEISDYKKQKKAEWKEQGYSRSKIKDLKKIYTDDNIRDIVNGKKKREANKKVYEVWDKAEEALERYERRPNKEIAKKAIEMAKKDGLKRSDPDFDYYVFGDTPSENYYKLALDKDPTYKKLRKSLDDAYSKVKEADKRWEEQNRRR